MTTGSTGGCHKRDPRFLPRPMLKFSGPGWVEATLHEQPAGDYHPERLLVHLVAYHPRRTTQPAST